MDSMTPNAARSPEIKAAFKEAFNSVSPAKKMPFVKRVSEGSISYFKSLNFGSALGMLYSLINRVVEMPHDVFNSFLTASISSVSERP